MTSRLYRAPGRALLYVLAAAPALLLCAGRASAAPPNVVTNTKDSGAGSLRAAMTYAQAHAGTTIVFNIAKTGDGTGPVNFDGHVFTIKPLSQLPDVSGDATAIDGTTQTAFTGNTNTLGPEVVVNGSLAGANHSGFVLKGKSCTVKGLVVNGFAADGIDVAGAVGASVQACYVGTNSTGDGKVANGINGIEVYGNASSAHIGGAAAGAGNLISGNGQFGVFLTTTSGDTLQANLIGTDRTGTVALGNAQGGVQINGAASCHITGGATPTVISGNGSFGVRILSKSSGNQIDTSLVGTNGAGTAALPNGGPGVEIDSGSTSNTVGGTGTSTKNVISGNSGDGILITGAGTNANTVHFNLIGVNAAGTAAIPNSGDGVRISNRASRNTIGGGKWVQNVISGNGANGVEVTDLYTSTNTVTGNFIGVDGTGSKAVPNQQAGVLVADACDTTTVGLYGAANLVSGNKTHGVYVYSGPTVTAVNSDVVGLNLAGTGAVANGGAGVVVQDASGVKVNDCVVSGNTQDGIRLAGVTQLVGKCVITLCYVGTNTSGTAAVPNGWAGISLGNNTWQNTIGGSSLFNVNVISGNTGNGVQIGPGTPADQNNTVGANLIGTDVFGKVAIPNGGHGVWVGGGSNFIGGSAPGARNVISGNKQCGIVLSGDTAKGTLVYGNVIGLDESGLDKLGNGGDGVRIEVGAHNNYVGGALDGTGNVISGNAGNGISLTQTTHTNFMTRNVIGRDKNDSNPIGNSLNGISIVDSISNEVGTGNPNYANSICANGRDGVLVKGYSTGDMLTVNRYFFNGGLGINLQPAGEADSKVTPNDSLDKDTGPNALQNFPVITGASTKPGNTHVVGSLSAKPKTQYRIEFYLNLIEDPTGYGEGDNFFNAIVVTTNSTGVASFNLNYSVQISAKYMSAVAIELSTGNTSEFGKDRAVTAGK